MSLSLSGYSSQAQKRVCDLEAICISPADTVVNGKGLLLRFGRKNLGPNVMFSQDTTFYQLYQIVNGEKTLGYAGAFKSGGYRNDTVHIGDSTIYRDNYQITFSVPNLTEPLVFDYCVLIEDWRMRSNGKDTARFNYIDPNASNNSCCKQVVIVPTPTSVVDLDESSEGFTVYPNPANHTLYLRTDEAIGAVGLELSILDMMGRSLLVKGAKELQERHGLLSVDVSQLPAGLYQVHLRTAQGLKLKRFSVYR